MAKENGKTPVVEPPKMGRPQADLSPELAEKYAAAGCTLPEIADFFGVCRDTLWRRKREDPAFAEALAKGRAQMRVAIRRKQLQKALAGEGDTKLLIHLGVTVLGQRRHDRLDVSGRLAVAPDLEGVRVELIELLATGVEHIRAARALPILPSGKDG